MTAKNVQRALEIAQQRKIGMHPEDIARIHGIKSQKVYLTLKEFPEENREGKKLLKESKAKPKEKRLRINKRAEIKRQQAREEKSRLTEQILELDSKGFLQKQIADLLQIEQTRVSRYLILAGRRKSRFVQRSPIFKSAEQPAG